MRFSIVVALASLFTTVLAADHLVLVGDGGLKFNPTFVNVVDGDTVTFEFRAKNHSVTQSTFAKPCELQQTPALGVDSGFQFVQNGTTAFAQWRITIDNATAPLWFFCAQANHCQQGMVFAINPTAEKSFDAYLANAQNSGASGAAGGASSATGAASQGTTLSVGGASTAAGALKTSFTMVPTAAVTNTLGGPTPSLAAAGASTSSSTLPNGASYRMNLPTTSVLALVGLVAGLAL